MAAYKKSNSGYLPFIQKEKVTSPYTDIQNRAKVDASLKCIMGSERIHINSLNLLPNEFGPNGEQVFEPDNGDTRVRVVGDNQSAFSTSGMYVNLLSTGYVEVTFYGTGLNLLHRVHASTIVMDAFVDGVSIGTFFDSTGHSIILNARQYFPSQVTNVVDGLALGWHTVKIVRNNDTPSFKGFEILNEASQITVKSGKAHGNGYEYLLDSDQLIDYNLGFDNALDANVGTKGGRVITYLDPADGTVKKRLTKVDATAQYLGSTDHTNEVAYRRINWREFGRLRGDDFSTLGGSNSDRVFTLDDGTTTLVCNDCYVISGPLAFNNASSFITITFVGTGLDIELINGATVCGNIYVDGVSQGTWSHGSSKICSGLPYGTHTVKIDNSIYGLGFDILKGDIIVYQPKKPTLPEGAVELADYNVMADFLANTTASTEAVSIGTINKSAIREMIYSGTWAAPAIDPSRPNGLDLRTNTTSSSVSYTFVGTGFDMRFTSAAGMNATVSIDGSTNLSGFTTSSYSNGAMTFTAATGVISGEALLAGAIVSGLPYGKHTVTVTVNNTVSFLMGGFNIITPIHTPHTTFGSKSIKDCRNFDSMKDVNKSPKQITISGAFDFANGLATKSLGILQALETSLGNYYIWFEEPFVDNNYVLDTAMQGRAQNPSANYLLGNTDAITRRKDLLYVGILATPNGSVVGVTGANTNYFQMKATEKLEKDVLEE